MIRLALVLLAGCAHLPAHRPDVDRFDGTTCPSGWEFLYTEVTYTEEGSRATPHVWCQRVTV